MPWHLLITVPHGTEVTPVDSFTTSIAGYIVGFGPLGIIALALGWLLYKGWRLISPGREAAIRESARADLIRELERALSDRRHAEEQRDEARSFVADQLAPTLIQFTGATAALIPILQDVVRHREGGGDLDSRRRR